MSLSQAGSTATSCFAAYAAQRVHVGVEGDRLADGLGDRFVDGQPAPLAVEVDSAGRGLDLAGAERVGDAEEDVAHQGSDRRLVAIGLVGLEHRELGAVRGVDALVAEDAAHLVDPVDARRRRPS